MTLRFYDESDVPYIRVDDFYNLFLLSAIFDDGSVPDELKMTVQKNSDGTYLLRQGAGQGTVKTDGVDFKLDSAVVDVEKGTISAADISSFLTMPAVKINNDVPEEGLFIVHPTITEKTAPQETALDLTGHGISVYADGDSVWLPLATLGDMYGAFDSGVVYDAGLSDEGARQDSRVYCVGSCVKGTNFAHDQYFMQASRNNRTAARAQFDYNELCFFIDYFFGHPTRTAIASLMEASTAPNRLDDVLTNYFPEVKALLLSQTTFDCTREKDDFGALYLKSSYALGLSCLFTVLLHDGGHTSLPKSYIRLLTNDLNSDEYRALDVDNSAVAFELLFEPEGETQTFRSKVRETYLENQLTENSSQKAMNAFYGLFSDAEADAWSEKYGAFSVIEIDDADPENQQDPKYWKTYVEDDASKTAYVNFQSFKTNDDAWKAYYKALGTSNPLPIPGEDSTALIFQALERAKADGMKNVIIDLTNNGGGDVTALQGIKGLLSGDTVYWERDTLTGAVRGNGAKMDPGLTGDYKDSFEPPYADLNLAVMTNGYSFSCGNALPCSMWQKGYMILGERSDGGSCTTEGRFLPNGIKVSISVASSLVYDPNGPAPDGDYDLGAPTAVELVKHGTVEDGNGGLKDTKDYSAFYSNIADIGKLIEAFYAEDDADHKVFNVFAEVYQGVVDGEYLACSYTRDQFEAILALRDTQSGKAKLDELAEIYDKHDYDTLGDFRELVLKALIPDNADPGYDPDPAPAGGGSSGQKTETDMPFVDVNDDDYFAEAVKWALENGITDGTDETHFSPNSECTRAQMVTFLWRAAGKPEPKSTENQFGDVDEDAYYYKAVLWAAEQGITLGTGDGNFSPDEAVTRAQTVTFLYRAFGGEKGTGVPFVDVDEETYYHDAVLWAAEKGITKGIDETHFAPGGTCLRGQMVTFLYRAYKGA
ncbi:MAG: S-layer homology domain-containing protein [Oscillospiraceae bacterium]|nr:S-layer homology domain-containing protein [Oscillospiraceae bacterium]